MGNDTQSTQYGRRGNKTNRGAKLLQNSEMTKRFSNFFSIYIPGDRDLYQTNFLLEAGVKIIFLTQGTDLKH